MMGNGKTTRGTARLLHLFNGSHMGEWKEGERDGKGVLTYSNGDRYVGYFKNGKRHGEGKYMTLENRKMLLLFKALVDFIGKRNASETEAHKFFKKNVTYSGKWQDDKFWDGQGRPIKMAPHMRESLKIRGTAEMTLKWQQI